jgi:hypothetical protein
MWRHLVLRFLVGLIIVLALFCLVWTFLGEDAFIWVLLIGIAGGGFGLLFLPLARRGPEYAYQKWNLRVALLIILGVIGGLVGIGYVILQMNLTDEAFTLTSITIMGLVIVGTYFLGWTIGPPTRRRGWLGRRYPAVAAAIKRYIKPGDLLENYTPVLRIGEECYFLIAYHDRHDPDRPASFLLLDESGHPVRDMEFVRRAAKCKSLAISTIEYAKSQERLTKLRTAAQVEIAVGDVFERLRQEKSRFVELGDGSLTDLEVVLGAEGAMRRVVATTRALTLIEAEWAEKHGLGRLTEVDYRDAAAVEQKMREARRPLLAEQSALLKAKEPAQRLGRLVKERLSHMPMAQKIEEVLLGIADATAYLKVDNEDIYGTMTDEHWLRWRERMAWADEVDARLAEAPV